MKKDLHINLADVAQKEILTAPEAAVYLGVSVWNINKLCAARAIPYYKPRGKLRYFKRTELDAWALRNRIRTKDETQSKTSK